MSAIEFYLEKGYTPINKTVVISGPNTISVWTPASDKRVVLTDMSIATNITGTVAFYFDTTTSYRFATYSLSSSATITPMIGCIESTVVGGKILARTLGNASDGWYVNLTGFEI